MLSKEDNELLTKVGPATPMGELLRQYWVPALRAARLEADGPPIRVRLLGENFVAFRASDGRIGFLDEACPHRGASLALARNEECGLRCLYHGWKIDVSGKVVETPCEPASSTLASKVRVRHYPVWEAGGVVWVWLGHPQPQRQREGADPARPPQLPTFEFTRLPLENVIVRTALVRCNWLQVLEGLHDSAHVTSLHQDWLPKDTNKGAHAGMLGDLAPRYSFEERPYGFMANARRLSPDGTQLNRLTEYVFPFFCFIPNGLPTLCILNGGVPLDDEQTLFWNIIWNSTGPLEQENADKARNIGQIGSDPDNYYQPHYGPEQRWGQNRERMQRGESYSGFPSLHFEDFAVQESQGRRIDRSRDHLGESDVAIIRVRRLLLQQLRAYQKGQTPLGLQREGEGEPEIAYHQIRAVHQLVPPASAPTLVPAPATASAPGLVRVAGLSSAPTLAPAHPTGSHPEREEEKTTLVAKSQAQPTQAGLAFEPARTQARGRKEEPFLRRPAQPTVPPQSRPN